MTSQKLIYTQNKDHCYERVAIGKQDKTLCEKINKDYLKESCYRHIDEQQNPTTTQQQNGGGIDISDLLGGILN